MKTAFLRSVADRLLKVACAMLKNRTLFNSLVRVEIDLKNHPSGRSGRAGGGGCRGINFPVRYELHCRRCAVKIPRIMFEVEIYAPGLRI